MKLKYDFVINPIGDQYCASPTNFNDFNGTIFFSEVGKYIFEEMKVEIEKEELIKKIMNRYDGEKAEIEEEVDKFINILIKNNLLEM